MKPMVFIDVSNFEGWLRYKLDLLLIQCCWIFKGNIDLASFSLII